MRKIEDLTGNKYGRLTVLYLDTETNDKNIRWFCECECGTIKSFQSGRLKNGRAKSCGCISRVKDLTGSKYGRLTVVEFVELDKYHKAMWMCKCECGNEKITQGSLLTSGKVKSCGCLGIDSIRMLNKNNPRHKYKNIEYNSNSRLYKIHQDMLKRCYNKNEKSYKHYGGRGIYVCDEWKNKEDGYINFQNWSISNGYTNELTIDRIDVDSNYEPSNCRWATWSEQAKNKRFLKKIDYDGEMISIREMCNRNTNMSIELVKSAVRLGKVNQHDVIEYVDKKNNKFKGRRVDTRIIKIFNEHLSVEEIYIKYGISKQTTHYICRNNKSDDISDILERKIIKKDALIIAVMAKSGAGKDTISNIVSKDLNIPMIVSHTTRPIRNNSCEVEGETYYFIDNDVFELEKRNFIETREYKVFNGDVWRYGIHKNELRDKKIAIAIVDTDGCKELEKYLGKDKVKRIFIDVGDDERIKRLTIRGDNKAEIARRVKDDNIKFKTIKNWKNVNMVLNDNLEDAIKRVKTIIIDEVSERLQYD